MRRFENAEQFYPAVTNDARRWNDVDHIKVGPGHGRPENVVK